MITGIGASPWVWWLGVLVICLIVEGAVPGLVSIWFAFGALVALLTSLLNAPLWLQVTVFLVVSLAALGSVLHEGGCVRAHKATPIIKAIDACVAASVRNGTLAELDARYP